MENILPGNLSLSPAARIGRFWFQKRSLSPIPLFIALLVMPPNVEWTAAGYAIILGILIWAESIRIWAVGYAGSQTRTRGDRVSDFVHAGPYRHVRNPLYIANIFLYSGAGLLFGNTILAAIIFVYSAIQYAFIVAYEEEILVGTFGVAYDEFHRRVPRWIPSIQPRIQATPHTFSLKQALLSEKSTFYSISAMGLLFIAKKFLL